MRRALTILMLASLPGACTSSSPTVVPSPAPAAASATVTFTGSGGVLHVRVADTDPERAYGLMNVSSMPADRGMAFVFDQPTTAQFWMKDTLIPLSIAFVDASGAVVTILEMTPCAADPCEQYAAAAPYVLAVEANADWYADHAVSVGDHAVLHRPA
ncbi:MAG: DUF192 domain-containing protein [Actinomycetota bacterium]